MIIIYTNYDQVSDTLALGAQALAAAASARSPRVLGPPEDSKAVNIRTELASDKAPIFFFGHGVAEPYGLITQDALPFLDVQDSHFLAGRLIYATCCDSIKALEPAVMNLGATVVGYDGKLSVPWDKFYRDTMRRAVLFGPLAMLQGRTAGEVCRLQREGFNALAQELTAGPIEDQVIAVFLTMNADLVKLIGDEQKTM